MKNDKVLARLIKKIGGLYYEVDTDSFAFIVNTVVGQMLSNKAASSISGRLYELCNKSITPESIGKLKTEDLRQIGLSNAKAGYILQFADHISGNPDFFKTIDSLDDSSAMKEIKKMKGLGDWSAKMYLLFVQNKMDILPHEDGAFLQSFKWLYSTDEVHKEFVIKKCQPWKPYSSLASRYLYRALDEGFVKSGL